MAHLHCQTFEMSILKALMGSPAFSRVCRLLLSLLLAG
jgi:hypothetical protein